MKKYTKKKLFFFDFLHYAGSEVLKEAYETLRKKLKKLPIIHYTKLKVVVEYIYVIHNVC